MSERQGPSPGPRRGGRRPDQVEDTTPRGERFGGIGSRIAWLLRVHRLCYDGGSLSRSSDFLRRLEAMGQMANPTRVTRWESTQTAVLSAAPIYERALGLPAGRLTSVLAGVERSLSPVPPLEQPIRPVPPGRLHHELDELLERLDEAPRSASDWFELSSLFQGRDELFLPRSLWRRGADSLVDEMARSVGTAYVTRFEALRGLLARPAAQPHVLAAIHDYITDPDCQVIPDPLTVLQSIRARPVVELVHSLLDHHHTDVRRWAAWTAVGKIVRAQVEDDQLAPLVRDLVEVASADDRVLPDLRDVVDLLPGEHRARVARLLRHTAPLPPSNGAAPARAPDRGPTRLAGRIAGAAEQRLGVSGSDPMLDRLIEEALWHGFAERRHQAALLLMCSPYSLPVAEACAPELAGSGSDRCDGEPHAPESPGLMRLLSYLAGRPQRPEIHRHAVAKTCPLQYTALQAFAHLRPDGDSDAVREVVGSPRQGVSRAAVYALGMRGAPQLRDLAADPRVPESPRAGAAWWIEHGPALFDPLGPGPQSGATGKASG